MVSQSCYRIFIHLLHSSGNTRHTGASGWANWAYTKLTFYEHYLQSINWHFGCNFLGSWPYSSVHRKYVNICPGNGLLLFSALNHYMHELMIVQCIYPSSDNNVFIVESYVGHRQLPSQIARLMGPTWGPFGSDRTQLSPLLAPWTLLSGLLFSTKSRFTISQSKLTEIYFPCALM